MFNPRNSTLTSSTEVIKKTLQHCSALFCAIFPNPKCTAQFFFETMKSVNSVLWQVWVYDILSDCIKLDGVPVILSTRCLPEKGKVTTARGKDKFAWQTAGATCRMCQASLGNVSSLQLMQANHISDLHTVVNHTLNLTSDQCVQPQVSRSAV